MGVPESVRQALSDRYTIEREIGRGGMAVVYLAHDLRHNRRVALKILIPERSTPATPSTGPERFQREIYFAARLHHPHILTVLDSGAVPGADPEQQQLWYTMPFIEGESLRDRLNREPKLPIDEALRITQQAALALEYAHQQGVIHRDVKPPNILLTKDGSTLVADFGIARAVHSDDDLTESGQAVGSPLYMSPEQTDDQEVDARTDQYSLATVLYEMLAGEPPFVGRSVHAIVAKRLNDPTPSVRRARPEVDPIVEQVIQKAMASEPRDRFASVAEFAQALKSAVPIPLPKTRRWPTAALAVVVAALLIAAGALITSRRSGASMERPGGVRVVAVLPFENLGDSADAYFADGVADEVRTKLAQVPAGGLELIARGSSVSYRGTSKRPNQIAQELGADYLLTGTVRWEKGAGGNRVRVTPELVDARSGQTAHTRWVQQFDASLTDVFQVQTDIATKVVDAVGIVLADSVRRELSSTPTANLAAYDEFLKGEAASGGMRGDQASLHRAIGFYEHAVALDSTFALAWSQLSRARTALYSLGVPSPEIGAQAREAAERARQLKPHDAFVYLAVGDYYGSVNPIDNQQSLDAYEEGLRLAPDNVDLLSAAAQTQASLGLWDSVPGRLRRAALLDPRSAAAARRLSSAEIFLRNYPAADSAADRAVALDPDNPGMLFIKVLVTLARGDLDSTRAVIGEAAKRMSPATLYPFFASYNDLYWVLDHPQQQLVLDAPPSAYDNDRGAWALVRAELYQLRGDRRRTTIYADSARLAFEEQARAAPEDAQRRVLVGLTLAFLGRKAEAVRDGKRAVAMLPISRDGYVGPYIQLQLVRIYLQVGEPELALDQLEPLLRVPFYLSPGWLRIDPTFDPLRKNPRFQKLLAGTA